MAVVEPGHRARLSGLVVVACLVPVALAAALAVALADRWGLVLEPVGFSVLLGGVAVVYAGDRLVERGRVPDAARRPLVGAVVLGAGACAVGLSMAPGLIAVVAVLTAASLAYPWWRRLPLAKAGLVAAVWLTGLIGLPLAAPPGSISPGDLIILWLLLATGTVLCDIKDTAADRADGTGSLAARFGSRWARVIAVVGLVAAGGLAGFSAWWGALAAALVLAGLAMSHRLLVDPVRGCLAVDLALCLPVVGSLTHLP